jgi:type IV pilus assembly protein PilQ
MNRISASYLNALRSAGVWAALALLGTLAQAQNAIKALDASIQGGSEVIRVELAESLAAPPSSFSIQQPARIALDFPGVSNALGRSVVEVNQGNLKSVAVVQAGERTRMVLNLKQATAYRTDVQGKVVLVTLDPAVAVTPAVQTTQVFAENRNVEVLPIRDLDFRRGTDGSGRVVVELPNPQVGVDIKQQGSTLVVEFMKSSLPQGLRRRLDVTDFGTPIQTVTSFESGDRVRMVIEPKGAW